MANWILKTEPESYSFQHLTRDQAAVWDGVTNPVALSHLKSMKKGDKLMIYHTGAEKQCVGFAEVTQEAYLDPNDSTGRLVVVGLKAGKPLRKPVTLAAVRGEASLAEIALVRMPRLSVVPCDDAQWSTLLRMAGEPQ